MSDRVDDLVARLRREEKLRLVQGRIDPEGRATGYVPPVERLDVPEFRFTDGPLGVRHGRATAFPASIALAASWDADLAERFGGALAAEARAKGFEGVLAPGFNIARVPQCGRLFEYFGEDPHLAGRFAARTVDGIEARSVLSSPKHYVANNQEHARQTVSADVSERALREIYLPPIERAVEAGAGTVMAAYNRVGGEHVTQHERLLTDLLKGELGFDGVVLSDWWAVHDVAAAAAAGLDLEMPGGSLYDLLTDDAGRPVGPRTLYERWPPYLPSDLGELLLAVTGSPTEGPGLGEILGRRPFEGSLAAALEDGRLPEARLDDMVRRLLRQYERVGLFEDGPNRPTGRVPDHSDLAREVAIGGTVLLENDGVLPLPEDVGRIAVLGPAAARVKVGGGGSSRVTPPRRVSPLDGLCDRLGEGRVEFERGCAPVERPRSVREFLARSRRNGDLDRAVDAAARADAAVVVVQDDAAEGRDRESLALPGGQDRLVSAVAATGTPTVVVLATSGPVETPWVGEVDAVLETWYAGQEAGGALATVLFGDADPGGRLPVTFGRAAGDYPAKTRAQYPGRPDEDGLLRASYEEGVFVGYRHFDRAGVDPTFPFGHGLSYAEFAYADLDVSLAPGARDGPDGESPGTASVTVENTGSRPGREIVQAYVGLDEDEGTETGLPRPPRELAGFEPVALDAGESVRVEVPLRERAFAVYDERAGWTVDAGRFRVEAGRSSRDRRLSTPVRL